MSKFIQGLKHVPSTLAGVGVTVAAIVQTPQIQALATINPKVANGITVAGSVAAGLALIFGNFGGQTK